MNIQFPVKQFGQIQKYLHRPIWSKKPKQHINPRFRAHGKARIDIIGRVASQQDWDKLWKAPANPFPFTWTRNWKQCIEYRVDDFAAEVGFFIDFLGFPVDEFGPQYARFTSPRGDFYFSVSAATPEQKSTPPGSIRIQFQVSDLLEAVDALRIRNVPVVQEPKAIRPGEALARAVIQTPHGLLIDLIGEADLPEDVPQPLGLPDVEALDLPFPETK